MPTIGPVDVLVFLLAGAVLVFFAARKRVSFPVLVLLVVVLSPPVGTSLAFFVGAILDVFAPT